MGSVEMQAREAKRNLFALVAVLLLFCPLAAKAWNIVCGVSIAYVGECKDGPNLLAKQYQVDATLLKGISEYHAAMGELQQVDIPALKAGKAGEKDKAQIKSGETRLKASADLFKSAVRDGNQLLKDFDAARCKPVAAERTTALDTLRQAQKMADHLDSMLKKISSNTLPSVSSVHDGLTIIGKVTANGLKLSKAHMGKTHHSGAREEVKFSP
jgi:hypothetical protein